MREFTTPPPLLLTKVGDQDIELGLRWFCAHYLDRAPAFAYQTAGAAGLRAAGRIEAALLDAKEPGSKGLLHPEDWQRLRDVVLEPGELGAPPTGLLAGGEPMTIPDRMLVRFIDAITDAVDTTEEKAQAAE